MIDSIVAVIANFVLPYLVLSLFTMLIVEMISMLRGTRARYLRLYVLNMLGDINARGIGGAFFRHPLAASLDLGINARWVSYISPRVFSAAIMEILGQYPSGREVPLFFGKIIGALLRDVAPGAERAALERWYDRVMDNASGAYRRYTFFLTLLIAALIVVCLNFDAIQISNHVASRALLEKAVETRLKSAADGRVGPMNDLQALQTLALPIGWGSEQALFQSTARVLMKFAGLLTSILAVALGAPFLFDVLNRFVIVRSTIKPWEGEPESPPAQEAVLPPWRIELPASYELPAAPGNNARE